jgi:pyrroline-5-carboxylate reductase
MALQQKTVVLGIGKMGGALVKGWISSKLLPASKIIGVRSDASKVRQTASRLKIKVTTDADSALEGARLVILGVKPQKLKEVLSQVGGFISKNALVISIAAGVSTEQIEKLLPQGCPVVRVMPNTPSLLNAGMAAVAGGKRAKPAHVKLVLKLFGAVGKSIPIPEDQMDWVTAVSGSGPAYIFHMIEAMTEAGVKGGLDEKVALALVIQTVYGAIRMVQETGKSPAELRIQVTSPGGTTQAALDKMNELGFKELIVKAMNAAAERGAELRKLNG